MKKTIVMLAILATCGAVGAQDAGRALAARGYTGTVWVNSFDQTQPHLAHGVFSPDQPINASGYNVRYGMTLTGSGTVTAGADGLAVGSGMAWNPTTIRSDGSLAIDLLSGGVKVDSALILFTCGPDSSCPWIARFQTSFTADRVWSVRVYRHVQGSACGGEITPDFNGTCRESLASALGLPSTYQFSATDISDFNYVSKPGASTTVMCDLVMPLCKEAAPSTPPPVTPPPPAVPPSTPPVTPPPTTSCPLVPPCPTCPVAQPCPPVVDLGPHLAPLRAAIRDLKATIEQLKAQVTRLTQAQAPKKR